MKHTRYAVKTDSGYVRRKGSSFFEETTFDKADLYLSEAQAIKSAERQKGTVIKVVIDETMDANANEVGRRIRQIRKSKGLNQTDFSKRVGASLPAVSNWETGRNLPNNERLKAIADMGNLKVDELLRGEAE